MTACVLKTADDQYRDDVPFAAAGSPESDGIGCPMPSGHSSFFRIPPFPGARTSEFATGPAELEEGYSDELVALVRDLRVGGTYWAAQPQLPARYILARSQSALNHCSELARGVPVVLWSDQPAARASGSIATVMGGDCDPWHMLANAVAFVTERADEVRGIAAVLGVPTHLYDPVSGALEQQTSDARAVLAEFAAPGVRYLSPFDDHQMSAWETAQLCGFWRRMIDSNRDISCGVGFAFWKQDNIASLLWSGGRPFAFVRTPPEEEAGAVAIWRSKTPADTVSMLERRGTELVEVEDGFLRSKGLGADCIPPLSITVDRLGAHFDPAQASELEVLLETATFDANLLARARQVRSFIVTAGVGKYESGRGDLRRPAGSRRHILVPGQVEDDRSVQTGGAGMPNIELLRRVREQAPDAYILYKPHPDVLAGHRRGSVAERACLSFADEVVVGPPISALIEMADEVHVNTSLTGFEALMRDKPVTTYGAPFYAGWGVTNDLGAVPSRRTARRTIDELVAATLLLYPRYLDPVSGLPCPAEVVVARLAADEPESKGLIVAMRRLQGRIMHKLRSIA